MYRHWIGFMYRYPNVIPEPPATVVRPVNLVEPYPFESIYGAWWARNVRVSAKEALSRSAQRYLDFAGWAPPVGPG